MSDIENPSTTPSQSYFHENQQEIVDRRKLPANIPERTNLDPGTQSNFFDNGRFIYPGPLVRKNPAGETYLVRRGFMRRLPGTSNAEGTESAATAARLYFQFNPREVQRAVAGRDDIHNAITANPVDLLTPVNGSSNFTLNLLFNREAEVAAATNKVASLDDLRSGATNLARYTGQIGVLADIFVMDSIIGQGQNAADLREAVERVEYLQKHAPANGSTDEQTGGTINYTIAGQTPTIEELLKNNFEGNTAYLMPRPVRILMSDLFMIDGFVNHSTVTLLKFTKLMVPVMAEVGLQVEAKYIGFHRDETVLTRNWNLPFEMTTTTATTVDAITAPGGVTTVTGGQDAATSAIQDRMRNKEGLFDRAEHHGRWMFSSSNNGLSPEDPTADPPTLHQNFNLRFLTPQGAAQWMKDTGVEVKSVLRLLALQYQDHQGTWRTVYNQGSGSVQPQEAPMKRDGETIWTTRGAGDEHEIKITPQSGLYRGDNKRLHYDRRYRMKLQVQYKARSGGGTWVYSAPTTLNVPDDNYSNGALGTTDIDLDRFQLNRIQPPSAPTQGGNAGNYQ